MELERQKELERHRAGLLMFTELNKQSVEFSMRALRGALVLNGGAITALAAMGKTTVFSIFLSFAWGAFFAVLGAGLGYVANYYLAESWRGYQNPQKEKDAEKGEAIAKFFHIGAVLMWVLSLLCFLYSLIKLCH